jgi:hypothetical protein
VLSNIPPPVTPSIRRYCNYACSKKKKNDETLHLHKILLNVLPSIKFQGGCDPVFSVCSDAQKKIFFSKKVGNSKKKESLEFFCRDLSVAGDLQIQFFHKDVSHLIFSFQINIDREVLGGKQISFNKVGFPIFPI